MSGESGALLAWFQRLFAVVARAFASTKDTGNSTVMSSASGLTFPGAWYDLRSPYFPLMRIVAAQECIVVPLNIDEDANGPLTITFTFQFSDDGSSPTVNENRPINYFADFSNYSLKNVGSFFRAQMSLSRLLVGSELVILATDQWFITPPPFVRLADQIIERANAAMPQTFAYLKGFSIDGTSRNLSLDIDTVFQKRTPVDAPLPSGAFPAINPVLNTEPNVLDSGWLRVKDNFPGGQLCLVNADVSLYVFLMNASDALGNSIEGEVFPALVTTADNPSVSGAPFFDDYFRMLVVNASGTTSNRFTIRSQGFGAAPAPLYASINAFLADFFPAPLVRAVGAGKLPGTFGLYDNQRVAGIYSFTPALDPLDADEPYISEAIDVASYPTARLLMKADVASATDGVTLQWSDTADFAVVRSSRSLTFRAGDVAFGHIIDIRARAKWFRILWLNGTVAQAAFFMSLYLDPTPIADRVTLVPSSNGQTDQLDVSLTAQQVAPGALSGRVAIRLKNLSSSARSLFYGFSLGLTVSNGDELAAGEAVELDCDEFMTVYVITTSTGGTGVRCAWTELA